MRVIAVLLVALAFAATGSAFGSADYTGDTYPVITVRGGHFLITFRNRVDEGEKSLWYRTVIDATGTFVERRIQLAGEDAAGAERLHNATLFGEPQASEATTTVKVERGPGGRGRPDLVRSAEGTGVERIDLAWGDVKVEAVLSLAASPQESVLATSPGLFLHRFDRHGGGHVSVHLGEPQNLCSLSCKPRASPVLALGDRFVVAWVAKDASVKLTWWRPRDGGLVTKLLAAKADTNGLSLAVLGDAVLVTYSEPGEPGAPVPPEGYAVIRYHFLQALPDE